jgi:propionyl-CoA carboxylase alpha chain
MLRRLMIANRGEIVSRIARTARGMGIATVGVYSEPDRNAVHVGAVDLACALGGASPVESYLRGDAIIAAALRTGCDAVHPGYGFLAENADFARAVNAAGLTWVGPSPEQIALLGDKVAAKLLAIDAGVPTAPVIEVTADLDHHSLHYPLLVKAVAGGGGRGMRTVRDAADLDDAITAASREAQSAFGDGRVFLETYIERGRHVEVQIMGDAYGTIVHFGERECSIQRRNQKVVEEAPSPGITEDVRAQLHAGALALAKHVGYQNAGTVEFMVGETVDGTPTIAFLEVNTRLQVEHRVTEAVTGHDLVELQLRIAAGEPLGLTQDAITVSGHAVEVRLVAEDPADGWLPSTGMVTDFTCGTPLDSAVCAGSVLSADYDSLLANVVAHAPTRARAVCDLRGILQGLRVAGVRTNRDLLIALLAEPDFLAGRATTRYLEHHPDLAVAGVVADDDRTAHLLAVIFADEQRNRAADRVTGFAPSGWRNLRTAGQRRTWLLAGEPHQVEYVIDGDRAQARIGHWPVPGPDGALAEDGRRLLGVRLLARGSEHQVVEIDGLRYDVAVAFHGDAAVSRSNAGTITWVSAARFADHEADLAGRGPVSPLPGRVIAVHVEPGDVVADGMVLLVIEAMKMEHTITAHSDAVVTEVRFAVGDRVDAGELLVVLDAPPR